jgi:hypothetical protein
VSLNQLLRLGNETDFRFNVNYGFDLENREQSEVIEYVFKNQPNIILNNKISQTVKWHKLENELVYSANKSNYFFEEKMTANLHWKNTEANIVSNSLDIRQNMQLPRIQLSNHTNYSKLVGSLSLGMENHSEYTRLPQSLTILSPNLLPFFLSNNLFQNILFNDGFSDSFFSLNYKKLHYLLTVKAGVKLIIQNVVSEMHTESDISENFNNNMSWRSARFYLEPTYKIELNKLVIKTLVSINSMHTDFSSVYNRYFYINPRLNAFYEPNKNLKFNVEYSENVRYGNLNRLQTGYVLKRYNMFVKGSDELQRNATRSVSCGFDYKSISHLMNVNFLSNYLHYKSNLTPVSFIQDIYNFSWWEFKENPSAFWINSFSASKLFYDLSLTASLSLSFNKNIANVKQQGVITNYTNNSYGISPELKWKINNNINFDYKTMATFSGVNANSYTDESFITLLNQQLSVFLGMTKDLSIFSSFQHYYNKSNSTKSTNILFVDLNMQYIFKKAIVSVEWTNILNKKHIIKSSYSTINSIETSDILRPRELMFNFRLKL